jgi:hypothetical protein
VRRVGARQARPRLAPGQGRRLVADRASWARGVPSAAFDAEAYGAALSRSGGAVAVVTRYSDAGGLAVPDSEVDLRAQRFGRVGIFAAGLLVALVSLAALASLSR